MKNIYIQQQQKLDREKLIAEAIKIRLVNVFII